MIKALRLFDADRLRWLDEAAALGPLVSLRMGPVKVWVVTDAEAARSMLVSDATAWTRPPTAVVPMRVGVGENLFTQSDKNWAKVQPFVAPAFRRKALEARLSEVDAIVDDEIRAIALDDAIDLDLAMGRIALVLAAWMLLGDRLDAARAEEIARHQRDVVGWVGKRMGEPTGFLPIAFGGHAQAMKRERVVLYDYADEVIARAKGATPDDDVLGALLGARPSGRAFEPEELRGHVLGLFMAGNETTAAALSWVLVHAAQSPREWAKVREQPDCYTQSFVNESLRLTPAVWGIPRTPTKAGVSIAAGGLTTRVRRGQVATVNIRGINRDSGTWPDPLRFDPSRHDDGGKEQQRALIPFGLGPRGCIGQHLALAEMNAVVPALARRGNVTIEGTVTENANFALRVRGGLRGRFTADQNA